MPNVTLVDSNQSPLTQTNGSTAPSSSLITGGLVNDGVTPPVYSNGQQGATLMNLAGHTYVAAPVYPGTGGADGQALLGLGRRDSTAMSGNPLPLASAGFILNGTTWDRLKKPNLTSRIPSSAATTNATSAKASAGNVHLILALNTTASVKYLKLYNKASAPTVGTDTPVLTIPLPVSNALTEVNISDGGFYFSTGIAYALTGAAADADATALALGDVVGLNIAYS
jgi:hypothetical protein